MINVQVGLLAGAKWQTLDVDFDLGGWLSAQIT